MPCSFSAAQFGGFSSSKQNPTEVIPIPHLLSVLGTGTWSGPVTGLNQLQAQYRKKYGLDVQLRNFDSGTVDPSKWGIENRPASNMGEISYYAPDDVFVRDGSMIAR